MSIKRIQTHRTDDAFRFSWLSLHWLNRLVLGLALLLTLFGWPALALANLSVYPMVVMVGGKDNASANIRVTSHSDTTQYVQVALRRLVDPATEKESEKKVRSWDDQEIAISPAKFVLPAGAERSVRVISMRPPDEEAAYRIYIEAVDTLEDEQSISGATAGQVKVNWAWGVLVRARTAKSLPKLDRHGADLLNSGNSRIGIVAVAACQKCDGEPLSWLPIEKSIYPGYSYTLPNELLNEAVCVKLQVDGMDTEHTKYFPASAL